MAGKPQSDAMLYQVGIYRACGWNDAEIAERLGVTRQAIYMRQRKIGSKAIIELATSWTQAAMSRYIEERAKAAEEKAAEEIQRLKKRLRNKGYGVIEKRLDHALNEGTLPGELTPLDLKAAEMGIEREEGKALDRKAILERHEEVHRVEIDGGDLEDVLREVRMISEMRKKALPAYVDAETVES